MHRIMPFRYALGPLLPCDCEICHEEINATPAYPLVDVEDHNKLDGWVCARCYTELQNLGARIRRHYNN